MEGFFILYSLNTGRYNMGFDEAVLNYAIENNLQVPIFRLYGWSPSCVSLGRNQLESSIKDSDVDVVRRLTGGRALLHGNELTYSFVCPASFLKSGETVVNSYKEISGALALGFKKLGIDAEFPEEKKIKTKFEYCMSLSTGADLSYQGKKLVGSAQFRKQGYILQHGSILFDLDCEKIEKIFGEKPEIEKIALLKNIGVTELSNALKEGVEEYFSIRLQDLSEESLLHLSKCV